MALWLGLREAEEVAARAPALGGMLGRGLERRDGVRASVRLGELDREWPVRAVTWTGRRCARLG